MTTVASTQRKTNDRPWLVGLGVLFVIGIVAWIIQLTQGFGVLGLGQAVTWGTYIAAFFLLVGAGSGLVLLASLGDLGVLPVLKGMRSSLLLGAVGAFAAGAFMIILDVGKPERVLYMLTSPNFKSMFVWDFYTLVVSGVLALVYFYLGPKIKALPWIAAIAAAAVVVIEGFILSVSAATPMWHGAIVPALFLIEGLITAIGIVLAVMNVQVIGRILAALLAVVFALTLIEFVSVSYGGDPDIAANYNLLVAGNLAPLFWGQLLLGVVVPFVLLVWFSQNRTAVVAAAVLAILGVFVAKLDLLVAGQAVPFLGQPTAYAPTLVEVGGVLGGLGLAGLVFVLAKRYLPSKAEA
jgi:molybdopterin-containing oxidoreductase family membrane subunit